MASPRVDDPDDRVDSPIKSLHDHRLPMPIDVDDGLPTQETLVQSTQMDAAPTSYQPQLPDDGSEAPAQGLMGPPVLRHTKHNVQVTETGYDLEIEHTLSDQTTDTNVRSDDPIDPLEQLQGNDWIQLYAAYEEELSALMDEENKIWSSHEALMAFYDLWERVGSEIELERGSKRIRTQMHHVSQQEVELNSRRNHLIEVNKKLQEVLSLASRPRA